MASQSNIAMSIPWMTFIIMVGIIIAIVKVCFHLIHNDDIINKDCSLIVLLTLHQQLHHHCMRHGAFNSAGRTIQHPCLIVHGQRHCGKMMMAIGILQPARGSTKEAQRNDLTQ